MKNPDYDILIAGGGLVGMSLAIALQDLPLRIAMVEPTHISDQPTTGRKLALNYITYQILKALGLWHDLKNVTTPIKHIHISQQGSFGKTYLHADECQVEALGYVVEEHYLLKALQQYLKQQNNVTILNPAKVTKISKQGTPHQILLEKASEQQILTTHLLVIADGAQSSLRTSLKLPVKHKDYQSTAIVAYVDITGEHHSTAYERFIGQEVLALLPLSKKTYAVIWTVPTSQAADLLALDDDMFLTTLHNQFGYALGRFTAVSERKSYPLHLMYAEQQTLPGIVLMGNAAHAVNPIAAQGFNLALRNSARLAETLHDALQSKQTWYGLTTLDRYQHWAEKDQRQVIQFTDGLVECFATRWPLSQPLRSLGLLGLDICTPLKRLVSKRAMGLQADLPRLARGLTL